jgi:hypothetical protein
MMAETITITKGNQYDRSGYRLEIEGSSLRAWGGIARRMDGTTGLTWGGDYLPSRPDREAVEAAILEVIASGSARTIRIGQPEATEPRSAEWRSPRGLTLAEEMDREDSTY